MGLRAYKCVLANTKIAWQGIKSSAKLLLCRVPKLVNSVSGLKSISGQTNRMNLLQAREYNKNQIL